MSESADRFADVEEALEDIYRGATTVSVYGDEAGDRGAKRIAKALKRNSTVTTVEFGGADFPWATCVRDAGAKAFAEVLKVNTCLTELSFERNRIGNTGAQALAEALKSNDCLATLCLRGNLIGESGARAFVQALQINNTLTELDLGENPDVSQRSLQEIEAELAKNRARSSGGMPASPEEEATDGLAADLWAAFDEQRSVDVFFSVKGERIGAHRLILSLRSRYFAAMFGLHFKESQTCADIVLEDASPAAFQALLRYLYTEQLEVDDEVLLDLLILADKYQVDGLQRSCIRQLQRVLDNNNAIKFFVDAHRLGLDRVKAAALSFIKSNFRAIEQTASETVDLLKELPNLAIEVLHATWG